MNNNTTHDKIQGCMIGGAIGDALGYPIEFWAENQIFAKYGEKGITEYSLDFKTNKALISDDTQMSLFTADAVINSDLDNIIPELANAYQNWLYTQKYSSDYYYWGEKRPVSASKLNEIPELYARRAPGITCTSALKILSLNNITPESYIAEPQNNSKGCGGIMRVAPIALINHPDIFELDMIGAEAAAITHGHPLGFIPAAFQVNLINEIIFNSQFISLEKIIEKVKENSKTLFYKNYRKYVDKLIDIIDLAVNLSKNNASDIENIHRLGRGAVAEETLAIALYCTLRYQDDFSGGIIASVNHGGDSDSTGAATGNILGAIVGIDNIENKWKDDLELYELITAMADQIYVKQE